LPDFSTLGPYLCSLADFGKREKVQLLSQKHEKGAKLKEGERAVE
jgi:hypothetical protein